MTVEGGEGGSTLTVSLTVKYPGFFDDFPIREDFKYYFADFVRKGGGGGGYPPNP